MIKSKTLKKYTELWDKTEDLIKSITNTPGDYDEMYVKIKFNSDDNLPLNKISKLHNLITVARSVVQEDYPHVSWDKCLYEL